MTTKYKNILFSGMIASVILFTTSCTDQEPYTGSATIAPSSPTATINADDFQNIPDVEMDETYTYTISLSEPQIADVKFEVYQSGGTATEGEDFDIAHSVIIPAYTISAQGSLTIYADTDPEDQETIQITIGDNTTANVDFTPQSFDIVLDDYEEDDLNIEFDWGMDVIVFDPTEDYPDLEKTVSTCDEIDYDILAFNADGSFTGDWQAATGDCPETYLITLEDYPDGTYHFYNDLWSNGMLDYITPPDLLVPITATFLQAGIFKQTVVQMDSEAMAVDEDPSSDDYEMGFIASVTILNGVYTISTDLPVYPANKKPVKGSRSNPNK